MSSEKRLLLAIVLSMAVVLMFQRLFPQPVYEPPKTKPVTSLENTTQMIQSVNKDEIETVSNIKPVEAIITKIETDKFTLAFSNLGGTLKSIFLKGYNANIAKNINTEAAIFLIKEASFCSSPAITPFALRESSDSLTYQYEDTAGKTRVTKKYTFSNQLDYIELRVIIENLSSIPMEISYKLQGPSCIEPVSSLQGQQFVQVDASIDGKVLRKSSIKAPHEIYSGIIPWIALKNTYYSIALKTAPSVESLILEQFKNKKIATIIVNKTRTLMPANSLQDEYVFYAGPIDKKRLGAAYSGFENVVHYGVFGGISSLLLYLLGVMQNLVHNWGIAIILLTVLVNVILFPLTKISFKSMQRMQELQPHMEKLRKLHKDNPQRLNKEIMELYKQYNVNPFGGCLPMLLQLPIFFAFYSALVHSLELKNAKFLWIKDLSSPDALITFQQSYPFIGDKFNILPILTLILMVIQQRTATASPGNASPEMAQQQKIMAFMFPIIFGFILYNFPSGLVIYWFTNSLLMTTEQIMLKKAII